MTAVYGLSDVKAILRTKPRTLYIQSLVHRHLIGLAWIRLVDVEFEHYTRESLDPKRIHEVKRSMRERGLCHTDPPISLVSVDATQTATLRREFATTSSARNPSITIGRGRVSTLLASIWFIGPGLTTMALDHSSGRKLQDSGCVGIVRRKGGDRWTVHLYRLLPRHGL